DRMEQQSDEFYERVRDGYQELAKWQRDRVVIIEGWQSLDDIEEQIWKMLCSRFPSLVKSEN
ncbi:MAG: dTMP kinase, partial [Verrucomicrobiota bacterium]|nr:dTMP kinase [Verrucomicrobiota bacterium]